MSFFRVSVMLHLTKGVGGASTASANSGGQRGESGRVARENIALLKHPGSVIVAATRWDFLFQSKSLSHTFGVFISNSASFMDFFLNHRLSLFFTKDYSDQHNRNRPNKQIFEIKVVKL